MFTFSAPVGLSSVPPLNAFVFVGLIALGLSLPGCSEEAPIVTYQIPTTVPAALATEDTRMVAAILPQSDQAWFFKLMGRQSAVDSAAEEFRRFVEDIEFEDGTPVIGTLPTDWKRSGDRPMRFASIDINTPTEQLDLSISQLSRSDEWDELVSKNVNRWRGQVGLDPTTEKWAGAEQLDWQPANVSDSPDVVLAAAIWVDVTGRPSESESGMMAGGMMANAPFAAAAAGDGEMPADPHAGLPRATQEAIAAKTESLKNARPTSDAASPSELASADPPNQDADEPDSKLKFDRPDGWRDGKMSSMRLAAFSVGPEDAPAEVTIINAGGNLRNNIARWMGQIRESTVPDEDVDAAFDNAEKLDIDGREAQRFVLLPPSSDSGSDTDADASEASDATAIDGTVVPLTDDFAMFIKMTGPVETVRGQSDQMKSFLESLRF